MAKAKAGRMATQVTLPCVTLAAAWGTAKTGCSASRRISCAEPLAPPARVGRHRRGAMKEAGA